MKYPKKVYEDAEFYAGDEDILNHQQKIVKVRKKHECCQCDKSINGGENALCETGFVDGFPCRAYTCIDCCDKWIDEVEGGAE